MFYDCGIDDGFAVIMPAISMTKIINSNNSGLTDANNIMKDKETVNNYKFVFKRDVNTNKQNLVSVENYKQ